MFNDLILISRSRLIEDIADNAIIPEEPSKLYAEDTFRTIEEYDAPEVCYCKNSKYGVYAPRYKEVKCTKGLHMANALGQFSPDSVRRHIYWFCADGKAK